MASSIRDVAPVFFVSGAPGSGKTTVARALAQRYCLGFHLPLDDMREWVVAGIAHPVPWTDEAASQFDLAFRAAAEIARIYAGAGFTVVVDQVIFPENLTSHVLPFLSGFRVHKVLLLPSLDIARERNRIRKNKPFETSVLDGVIESISEALANAVMREGGWIRVDSSNLSVEQTVEEILRAVPVDDRPV